MTSQERLQRTLDFTGPDRIMVWGHPSVAGLYVHGDRLLKELNNFPFDNEIEYDRVPAPPPESLRNSEYHEFRTDAFGTELEFRIFGLHGHPCRYAFADWREAAAWDFGRMALPEASPRPKTDRIRICGWQTLFETLHAVRPMEEVLIGIALRDPDMLEFIDHLTEFRCREIEAYAVQGADVVNVADDWGTQTGPMISPADWNALFREPCRRMIDCAHRHGLKVLYHSCGELAPIWRELFDLGIDMFWPQIKLMPPESELWLESRKRKIAVLVRPDPQRLMPLGTPEEIDRSVAWFAEYARRESGGIIFHFELDNDPPWENIQALLGALRKHCAPLEAGAHPETR